MRLVSYWYENGCIFPDMGTVFIALDQATQENGCLKVLPGSQRVGRIDHVRVGDQVGADVERVTEVQKFLPLAHVEMEPGDALFFHCNLLHRSEQNHSDHRRWAFLVAYNRASNDPVMEHHHPRYTPMAKTHDKDTNKPVIEHYHPHYTPMSKVPNTAIKECTTATEIAGKDFFDPASEVSLKKVANSVIKTCATPVDPEEKDIWDPVARPSVLLSEEAIFVGGWFYHRLSLLQKPHDIMQNRTTKYDKRRYLKARRKTGFRLRAGASTIDAVTVDRTVQLSSALFTLKCAEVQNLFLQRLLLSSVKREKGVPSKQRLGICLEIKKGAAFKFKQRLFVKARSLPVGQCTFECDVVGLSRGS
ncbi:hypothetical protein Bbelb_297850 [Branchiostoma belcheri]|nr:hypothetical protein Bbelb_297850 [Branchiostoma belcheri]